MLSQEQKKAARKFSEEWKGKGYEKGESQKFWIDLLCNVYGVQDFSNFVYFENQIKEKMLKQVQHDRHSELDSESLASQSITNFIDIYIPSTKVMIEQKSIEKTCARRSSSLTEHYSTHFSRHENIFPGCR